MSHYTWVDKVFNLSLPELPIFYLSDVQTPQGSVCIEGLNQWMPRWSRAGPSSGCSRKLELGGNGENAMLFGSAHLSLGFSTVRKAFEESF